LPVTLHSYLLVVNSTLAINQLGLFGEGKLFSTQISGVFTSGQGQYGLIPAIWGTLLIVVVSMGIAIPVSMAMAIFASEFKLGLLGQGMRTLLGILGGIPSIIFGLMSIVFAQLYHSQIYRSRFVWQSDAAAGKCTGGHQTAAVPYQYSSRWIYAFYADNSLSCAVARYVIQNVPHSLKEASLALGAGRWHTLTNVTIPYSMAGIISASGLGTLKAMVMSSSSVWSSVLNLLYRTIV